MKKTSKENITAELLSALERMTYVVEREVPSSLGYRLDLKLAHKVIAKAKKHTAQMRIIVGILMACCYVARVAQLSNL